MNKIFLFSATIIIGIGMSAPANAQEYCREYTKTIIVGGVPQSGYGQACFKPDGSWEIVDLKGPPITRQPIINIIETDARNWHPQRVVYRDFDDDDDDDDFYRYDRRHYHHGKPCKHHRKSHRSRAYDHHPAYFRPIPPPPVIDLYPATYPRHGYYHNQPPRGFSFTYRD